MIIHFEEMDVEVTQLSSGKWQAIPCIVNDTMEGYGSTIMEAIVDLRDKMEDK
jgi:hypothetical protein